MTRLVDIQSGHANTPFLRAIGAMTISAHELEHLRDSTRADSDATEEKIVGWHRVADHLIRARDAVLDAASTSTFPGNTLSIEAEAGVKIAVQPEYVDKLASKMERHTRVGLALGVMPLGVDELAVVAS